MDAEFPCALSIHVPFPTKRLASTALRSLQVDKELSPLVSRTFSLGASEQVSVETTPDMDETNVLCVEYRATTNRMLRVSVNSFMESLNLILEVMQELDEDVLATGTPAS
ncbi:Pcc1-domain-containing protein [Xylariaceae sp. FL1272]|nr:Pcc1-domain-containing protein [Xylariaceae sp. FL1272]